MLRFVDLEDANDILPFLCGTNTLSAKLCLLVTCAQVGWTKVVNQSFKRREEMKSNQKGSVRNESIDRL